MNCAPTPDGCRIYGACLIIGRHGVVPAHIFPCRGVIHHALFLVPQKHPGGRNELRSDTGWMQNLRCLFDYRTEYGGAPLPQSSRFKVQGLL